MSRGLTEEIVELASRYGRYGYRRITALLRMGGWDVNHKRVERIWRQEGLKVPVKYSDDNHGPHEAACFNRSTRMSPDQTSALPLLKPYNLDAFSLRILRFSFSGTSSNTSARISWVLEKVDTSCG